MTPGFAASPALRLAAALLASAALHAGAACVAAALPRGVPTGAGAHVAAPPVNLRIVGADPTSPPAPVSAATQPNARASAPEPKSVAAATPPPGASVGVLEAPRYYPPSQLDTRPYLLTRVDPLYPQGAPPDGGSAVVRVLIGEDGKVERTVVVSADPSEKFGAAAAAAFGDAQFSPGKLNGVAVKSQLLIEMTFNPIMPPGAGPAPKATTD